ncbi:universal stress protein [Blastococcus sp. SYSU D00669]
MPDIDVHEQQALGERVLTALRARARTVASDLEVFAYVLPGRGPRPLWAETRDAGLLVLGWTAPGARMRRRALAARLLGRAACPVVVVHPCDRRTTRPAGPRVVVLVDGTPTGVAAIEFAFEAARQRGVPLRAVHAWRPDSCADLEAVRGDAEVAESHAGVVLERAVAATRSRFPDVPVEARPVCGDPLEVVAHEARGAALTVVGSGRWALARLTTPSVGRRLVGVVSAPVAVVPPSARRVPRPESDDVRGRTSSG